MAVETRNAEYSLIDWRAPGEAKTTIGVLLHDAERDRALLRFRRDLNTLAPEEEDAEVLDALASDLATKEHEWGAARFLDYLEDTLSNNLTLSDRDSVLVEDWERALDRLYRRNVQPSVLKFRTHLPVYSVRAAAGHFLENDEASEEGWEEMPETLKLDEGMFLAHIAGHSMEPLIPDGALAVFQGKVPGSRNNRLVLVQDTTAAGDSAFAVKRYKSEKTVTEEGWRHQRILLESLNPGYPSWYLEPDEEKYRIVAEFVRVLREPEDPR